MTPMLGSSGMVVWLIALGALMLFWLMSRGQVKTMKEQQEQAKRVCEGDRVILQSGIFGTITHLGDKQMVVEVAPGIELTCMKAAVLRKASADDEEFEFEDEQNVTDESAAHAPEAGVIDEPVTIDQLDGDTVSTAPTTALGIEPMTSPKTGE
ncbi:MAG: preprotein translocase subunit YajC [Propionibacteriaceae bacterium]